MNIRSSILFLSCLMVIHQAFAQNDTTARTHKFTLNGYIKYLELVSFSNEPTELLTNSEIHNRLNFRYQPNEHLNFRLRDQKPAVLWRACSKRFKFCLHSNRLLCAN